MQLGLGGFNENIEVTPCSYQMLEVNTTGNV